MKLTSSIFINKHILKSVFLILMLLGVSQSNNVIADNLTYSPDQWPRHWNKLINQTRQQGYQNNNGSNESYYGNQQPERSPMWGVVPIVKQKRRRSLTPEYNTSSHIHNYYNQNNYAENYSAGNMYPGLGYGYSSPYAMPFASPYSAPLLAPLISPGLAAPGIPMTMLPYAVTPSYMGGFPGMGPMMW